MGDENYIKLVSRISQSAGLSVEDIERRVEAKRAKLSGLVSKEGAAQIVAAELGINFDQERMKISELMQGMRRANVVGKILEVYPVRDFNKNGREGRVCNLLISDESSNTRAVLWDTHHIELIEKGKLKKGDVIEIANANVKNGELHLNSFSAKKRFIDALFLSKLAEGIKRLIVLGDTNIWQCGHWFVFKYDKKAYRGLVKSLNDISRSILSTTYLGFSLDKVFCSKDIKVQNVTSPKVRSHFMDHYPVYFDLE